MSGTLTLIPTPIDEENPLESVAWELLNDRATNDPENCLFVIEDLKPGRRRWLRWKLPRSVVEDFVLYNEHTHKEQLSSVIAQLQKGKDVFLMSDGGLPAFCDPGRDLVNACHQHGIKVTATPFANSIALAVALSGLDHDSFSFGGFLPLKNPEREKRLKELLSRKETLVLMDTPYRFKRLIEELEKILKPQQQVFAGIDLGSSQQQLVRGSCAQLLKSVSDWKREFVLVISK